MTSAYKICDRRNFEFCLTSNFISVRSPSVYKLSMIRFVHKVHFDVDFTLSSLDILKKTSTQVSERCRCTCHRHSFRYSESTPPIGDREVDGLPKASVAELLVIKQDLNSCDRVG